MPDDQFRLDGKPAIVVGAALGIGRAIAQTFAAAGARVACLDIDEAAAVATATLIRDAGGTAIAHRCDVTSETSIAAAVLAAIAAHGPPRVLVNGAAMREPTGTIVELAPADWNRAIAINLSGASHEPCRYSAHGQGRWRQHHPPIHQGLRFGRVDARWARGLAALMQPAS